MMTATTTPPALARDNEGFVKLDQFTLVYTSAAPGDGSGAAVVEHAIDLAALGTVAAVAPEFRHCYTYDYDRFRRWLRDAAGVAPDAPLQVAAAAVTSWWSMEEDNHNDGERQHDERRPIITRRDQFADFLGCVVIGAAPPDFDRVRGRWVLRFAPLARR